MSRLPKVGAIKRLDIDVKTLVRRLGRTIYFFDEVCEESVCEALVLLRQLEQENKKQIEIVIDSPGGNCYDGFALYDAIRSSDCTILTIGTGIVASMAVTLFLAGDERAVTENVRIMNHQVSTYIEGRMTDADIDVKETKILEEMLLEIISERTGNTIKSLKEQRQYGDRYLSSDEAVAEGYSDRVIINKRTIRRRRKKKK